MGGGFRDARGIVRKTKASYDMRRRFTHRSGAPPTCAQQRVGKRTNAITHATINDDNNANNDRRTASVGIRGLNRVIAVATKDSGARARDIQQTTSSKTSYTSPTIIGFAPEILLMRFLGCALTARPNPFISEEKKHGPI